MTAVWHAPAVTLTRAHLDAAGLDDRWCGGGYLRARAAADPDERVVVDGLLIDFANAEHWSYEDLFRFANGHNGRLFGDAMFAGAGDDAATLFVDAVGEGLLDLVVPLRR